MIGRRGGLRVATGLGLLVITAAAASATYQALRERTDRRRFPPPGRLVDVDGRRLHLWCEGEGAPTVVIVAALGTTALEWARIQRLLSPSTLVCLYDRGGLGWSEAVPGQRPEALRGGGRDDRRHGGRASMKGSARKRCGSHLWQTTVVVVLPR